MKYKDKRLKIMNEILSGIKVKKKKKPNRENPLGTVREAGTDSAVERHVTSDSFTHKSPVSSSIANPSRYF